MEKNNKITLHPVETKRASEEIYFQIRQLIMDGEIKAGDRLPSERKMMEMMQRSRPTIREAMRMLEREGYIKTIPGSSGAVVQECSVDNAVQSLENIIQFQKLTIENILEFRMIDETQAAKLAAIRRTDEDIIMMQEILQKAESCLEFPQQFIDFDVQFHIQIAKASKNEMFCIMLQVCRNIIGLSLMDKLTIGSVEMKKNKCINILKAHKAIFEAIKNRDENSASSEMHKHLKDAEFDLIS